MARKYRTADGHYRIEIISINRGHGPVQEIVARTAAHGIVVGRYTDIDVMLADLGIDAADLVPDE